MDRKFLITTSTFYTFSGNLATVAQTEKHKSNLKNRKGDPLEKQNSVSKMRERTCDLFSMIRENLFKMKLRTGKHLSCFFYDIIKTSYEDYHENDNPLHESIKCSLKGCNNKRVVCGQ